MQKVGTEYHEADAEKDRKARRSTRIGLRNTEGWSNAEVPHDSIPVLTRAHAKQGHQRVCKAMKGALRRADGSGAHNIVKRDVPCRSNQEIGLHMNKPAIAKAQNQIKIMLPTRMRFGLQRRENE